MFENVKECATWNGRCVLYASARVCWRDVRRAKDRRSARQQPLNAAQRRAQDGASWSRLLAADCVSYPRFGETWNDQSMLDRRLKSGRDAGQGLPSAERLVHARYQVPFSQLQTARLEKSTVPVLVKGEHFSREQTNVKSPELWRFHAVAAWRHDPEWAF